MSTNFPQKLDTTASLFNIADVYPKPTTLTQTTQLTDSVLNVASTTGYPLANGLIVVENEQIFYTGTTAKSFTGCLRAANGTINAAHLAGTTVNSIVTATAYTNLRDAILQLESLLSINAVTILATNPPNLNVSGNLIVGGTLSVTGSFSPTTLSSTTLNTSINSVAFSTTPTFNAALGNIQTITLTGNVISSTLTNAVAGQYLYFLISQDGSGSRTFTWPANFRGTGNIGLTASKGNVQTFFYDGSLCWPLTPMLINL
jgi:hypothetical protein